VLGIRLLVMLLVPALVLLFGAAVVWPEKELSDDVADISAVGFGVGFEVVYYWLLVHHVRGIARPTHAETGTR